MGYIALSIIAEICAFGWFNRYVCCEALLLYMQKRNDTLPSGKEIEAYLTEAWLRMLRIKKDRTEL